MARSGPVTINEGTVALGFAQIRVGSSATNIANIHPALTSSDSIGALANTTFRGPTDWYKLESGFPLIEDFTTPIREAAQLECAFKEMTPANIALALGHDPKASPYSTMTTTSGEVPLGGRVAPKFLRMEAVYTYPSGSNYMYIIFPRAQVSASPEVAFAAEDAAAVTVIFEAKSADSNVTDGNAVWDDKPLGRIHWE